ncbi:hypothetical protein SUDANB6_00420 [Streptomyces sp. enrichment culture]
MNRIRVCPRLRAGAHTGPAGRGTVPACRAAGEAAAPLVAALGAGRGTRHAPCPIRPRRSGPPGRPPGPPRAGGGMSRTRGPRGRRRHPSLPARRPLRRRAGGPGHRSDAIFRSSFNALFRSWTWSGRFSRNALETASVRGRTGESGPASDAGPLGTRGSLPATRLTAGKPSAKLLPERSASAPRPRSALPGGVPLFLRGPDPARRAEAGSAGRVTSSSRTVPQPRVVRVPECPRPPVPRSTASPRSGPAPYRSPRAVSRPPLP